MRYKMRCIITKILIDRSEDSPKPLPRMVSNHINKCRECKTYLSLGKQLYAAEPDYGISDPAIFDLNRKIFTAVTSEKPDNKIRVKSRLFSPVLMTAIFLIAIISLGVILYKGLYKPSEKIVETQFINVAAAKNTKNLNDLFSRVESPIIREAEELKKSVKAAGKYLKSVMDFGLPGIPD